MVGIYKITSPSGKVYFGQTRNMHNRLKDYRSPSCFIKQAALYHSMKKYGVQAHNIEFIHELPVDVEQSVLDEYEIFCISQYKEAGHPLLNLKSGGGSKGSLFEESRRKISRSKKGVRQSKEAIESRSKAMKGHKKWSNINYSGCRNHRWGTVGTRTGCCGELHPAARIILNTETGIFYYGSTEAATAAGLTKKQMRSRLKGEVKNKTSFKYV